jgi:hypothetical protein
MAEDAAREFTSLPLKRMHAALRHFAEIAADLRGAVRARSGSPAPAQNRGGARVNEGESAGLLLLRDNTAFPK